MRLLLADTVVNSAPCFDLVMRVRLRFMLTKTSIDFILLLAADDAASLL